MAYDRGSFPMERASKIAHMSLIRDPSLTQLLQSFHSDAEPRRPTGASCTGTIDLSPRDAVLYVVTVDGGYTVAPNPVRRDKALSLVQVGTSILSMGDLQRLQDDPMMDPRDVVQMLRQVDYRPAALPLAGVRIPGQTVRQTNRTILNAIFAPAWTNLYFVLEFLLWRDWLPLDEVRPSRSMECINCEETFSLPRGQTFQCLHCGYDHYLSDYLDLLADQPEDRSRQQVASMLMATIETLAIFELPVRLAQRQQLHRLSDFVFVKDGPLMLRAGGYRLVDSLRDFIEWLYHQGYKFSLVGVEKTGEFAEFLGETRDLLPKPGDFFVPTVKFMQEEVRGTRFDPATYRNRVSYGSRVGIRLSPDHVVALQLPTKEMSDTAPTAPTPSDFIHLDVIARTLAGLTSAAHDNALVPLVLANQAVSLSDRPSSRILDNFVNGLIRLAP